MPVEKPAYRTSRLTNALLERAPAARVADRKLRALVRHAADALLILDELGRILFESDAIERMLGRPVGSRHGQSAFTNIHEDDRGRFMDAFADLVSRPGAVLVERFRVRHYSESRWVWMEAKAQNQLDEEEIAGVVCSISDISARMEADEALRASERRFRKLVKNSSDLVTVIGVDGTVLYESDSSEALFGYRAEEVMGRSVFEFVHPDDRAAAIERLARYRSTSEDDAIHTYRICAKDGTIRWMEASANFLVDDPDVRGIVINARDVTQRQRAEAAVALRDRYLAAIVALQRELLRGGRILERADEIVRILGHASQVDRLMFFRGERADEGDETWVSHGLWCAPGVPPMPWNPLHVKVRWFRPELYEALRRGEMVLLRMSELPENERRAFGRIGSKAALHAPILVRGELYGLLCFHRIATDDGWTQAEQDHLLGAAAAIALALSSEATNAALQAEEERMRVTVGAIADAVIATDKEGRVNLANPAAVALLGWSERELVGRPLTTLFEVLPPRPGDFSPPHPRGPGSDAVGRVLTTGETIYSQRHVWAATASGPQVHVALVTSPIQDKSGAIVGVVRVFRDLTTDDRLKAELVKLEKFDALAVVAAGIAHDFNNLLTTILGNVALARETISGYDLQAAETLLDAEAAGRRARDLTSQLLTFTKGGSPIRRLARLTDIVRDSTQFALLGTRARARIQIAPDLPVVEVDSGQISQVVHNLALNAAQAMRDGGLLDVSAAPRLVAENDALPLRAGEYVELTFRDEGPGVPAEVRGKIFDPFFTTKEAGSGLGLATAFNIIKNHHGCIVCDPGKGAGATFRVLLPAVRDTEAEAPPTTPTVEEVKPTEEIRVLLMDDEPQVRTLAGRILARLGYLAELARDETEALAHFRRAREAGNPFHVAVLDLTIPGGPGGLEVLRLLRVEDPDLPAVACSGYFAGDVLADFVRHGFNAILPKPYRPDEMGAAIQAALASAVTAT